ncbi:2-hydroxyglutaryl-CoA dehydratase [Alkalibaculum sp. M08DMB]|uniref:2-hydroxyglutaryl-CoA dehydratase n=1 Tax=Alkalibaculum sporogenes TaxID=2655001 RepID=A0A6A7K7E8_9FIRM|nr:acyl-CoA dehydratase activase-related protein [Alkalibaculum sporogenes]MPW25419.1 2-hydroxyglutaryl-CoA dehydratase [Alkalibaculum sporogenes]
MILTFPHMGNLYLAGKILLDALKIEYIIPPLSNKKSLEIGSSISPEEMCLPFKIMMGNYIQSIQQGADTILLVSSCGPCRFGEYSELQMRLLKKAGYSVKFILADLPDQLKSNDHICGLDALFNETSLSKPQITKAVLRGIRAMNIIDHLESKAHLYAGYEINRGESKKLLKNALSTAYSIDDPHGALAILNEYKTKMNHIQIDNNKSPLKIAIIGEIYTVIDSFSNLNIEEKLMDYGVSSSRKLTPSWWIKDSLLKLIKLNGIDVKRFSKDYLSYWVGGHGRECVAEAVMAHEEKYHGAIQIFPVGCMPEVVSKSILPSISRDKDFPIMSLVVDEMTGEAGYTTRIEAFLDLLERRNASCTI